MDRLWDLAGDAVRTGVREGVRSLTRTATRRNNSEGATGNPFMFSRSSYYSRGAGVPKRLSNVFGESEGVFEEQWLDDTGNNSIETYNGYFWTNSFLGNKPVNPGSNSLVAADSVHQSFFSILDAPQLEVIFERTLSKDGTQAAESLTTILPCIYLDFVVCQWDILNTTNTPQHVILYDLECRDDGNIDPGWLWVLGLSQERAQTNSISAGVGPGSYIGARPEQSEAFMAKWLIGKRQHIYLQPGETHRHKMMCKVTRVVDAAEFRAEKTSTTYRDQYIKGMSRFLLMHCYGPRMVGAYEGKQYMGYAPVGLAVARQWYFRSYEVPSDSSNFYQENIVNPKNLSNLTFIGRAGTEQNPIVADPTV